MFLLPRLLCWTEYLLPVSVGEREEPYTDCQSSFLIHHFVIQNAAAENVSSPLHLSVHFDHCEWNISSVFVVRSAIVISLTKRDSHQGKGSSASKSLDFIIQLIFFYLPIRSHITASCYYVSFFFEVKPLKIGVFRLLSK